jgi:hypothetical protein
MPQQHSREAPGSRLKDETDYTRVEVACFGAVRRDMDQHPGTPWQTGDWSLTGDPTAQPALPADLDRSGLSSSHTLRSVLQQHPTGTTAACDE